MNEKIEEKKIAEEQLLNDNKLGNVVGGVNGEDDTGYFNCTFICPLCHKEHSFKYTMGTMSQGFGLNIIEEESPCKKIDYLSSIISLDSYARTGILRLRAVDGIWYDNVPFTVVSATCGDMTVIF